MTFLNLKNVTYTAGTNRNILNQINYHVNYDDFVILLGSNGSGKSSLLKLLHRQNAACGGDIHFLGKLIAHHSSKEFCRQVAVLTQNCADSLFSSLTVYENYLLANHPQKYSRKQLQDYLTEYNPNLVYKLDVTIDKLSGGEKQALALALCFLQPPSLLLLDEHTSALDPKTSEQIMQLTQQMITRHNITCIMTTHDLDVALRYGNRMLVLREGEIHQTYELEAKNRLSKEGLLASYF